MAMFAHLISYMNASHCYVIHTLLALCKNVFILQILISQAARYGNLRA